MDMIDWRTLLKAPTYPQYPHNEQKGKARGSFADIAGIAHSEATEKNPPHHVILPNRVDDHAAPLASGNRITWQGSNGKVNDAVIDFLHPYPGELWAFCTLPDGEWCAVNTTYLKRENPI
jgi:hypothetical protein